MAKDSQGQHVSPSLTVRSAAIYLEAHVLKAYPDWWDWSYGMRVALGMLPVYRDAGTAIDSEGLREVPSEVTAESWRSWRDAVDEFYERGRVYRVYKWDYVSKNPKMRTHKVPYAVSASWLLALSMNERVYHATRRVLLDSADANDFRLVQSSGVMYTVERDYMAAKRSVMKAGGSHPHDEDLITGDLREIGGQNDPRADRGVAYAAAEFAVV